MRRIALGLLAFAIVGCGVKGPPRPPGVDQGEAELLTVPQPGLEGLPAGPVVPEAVPRADEPELEPGADAPEAESDAEEPEAETGADAHEG